jgi:hypothetical protein
MSRLYAIQKERQKGTGPWRRADCIRQAVGIIEALVLDLFVGTMGHEACALLLAFVMVQISPRPSQEEPPAALSAGR